MTPLLPLLARSAFAAAWPDLTTPPAPTGGGEADAAVVVGIEDYAFADDVRGARAAAEAWYAWLVRTRKVPVDRVALLRDAEGTDAQIREAARMAASAKGTVWLVYVGHGAPSADGRDRLLVGADAQRSATSLGARSVPVSELLATLSSGGAASVVMVLDAGFDGRTPEGEPLLPNLQPVVPTTVLPNAESTVLVAAAPGEMAGRLPGTGWPAFSYLALGALRGWGDADADGAITASEVAAYTARGIGAAVRGRSQVPALEGVDSVLSRGTEAGPDLDALSVAAKEVGQPVVHYGDAPVLQALIDALVARAGDEEALAAERDLRAAAATFAARAQEDWTDAVAPLLDRDDEAAVEVLEAWIARYGESQVHIGERSRKVEVSHLPEARARRDAIVARRDGGVTGPEGYPLRYVGAGSFLMGRERPGLEDTRRTVEVTAPYLLGEIEVTRELWTRLMGDDPVARAQSAEVCLGIRDPTEFASGGCPDDPRVAFPCAFSGKGGALPVSCISWIEAVTFANALSEREGLDPAYEIAGDSVRWRPDATGYRLPTEAEWEHAARIGAAPWPQGVASGESHPACSLGNVFDEKGAAKLKAKTHRWATWDCSDGAATLAPPRGYAPNGVGLYDAVGNVAEWAWDWHSDIEDGGRALDPLGPETGRWRVVRGGSFGDGADVDLYAYRSAVTPDSRSMLVGFRLARSLPR